MDTAKYSINLIPVDSVDEIEHIWQEEVVKQDGSIKTEAVTTCINIKPKQVELSEQQVNRLRARYQNIVITSIEEEQVVEKTEGKAKK